IAENAASAAIVTLGFTVGTWALEYVAAYRGGFLQQLASFTPTAALRNFEQGLLRLSTILALLTITIAGFALATIWLHTGRTWRYRFAGSAMVLIAASLLLFAA